MASKQKDNAKQLQGITANLTGTLKGLVVTKKGVIYFRSENSKKF